MSYQIKALSEPVALGEGPHWDAEQQALFFVSLPEQTIHKYVLATGVHTKTKLAAHCSFIIPVEGARDQFVVSQGRELVVVEWDGAEGSAARVLRSLGSADHHHPTNSFNDGKVDPRGRLFAGTMSVIIESISKMERERGSIYRVDANRGLAIEALAGGVTLANGLAWDLQEKAFYYVDSLEYKIRRYDYDVDTGDISNPTFVFDLLKHKISDGIDDSIMVADGMTIDTDGNLWVAVFNSSSVIKVDPRTGKLLQTLKLPVKQITSVTFGGPDLDALFVTTGSISFKNIQQPPPPAGATLMVTGLGVKGHPNVNFKLHP